jgi:epoxyqueuosine reductase
MFAEPPARIDTRALREWAIELGIDECGVCEAIAYERAEAAIEERRARGLFADLQFTMTRTGASCHPERLLDGRALSVISAALCYWYPDDAEHEADPARPTRGRIARYTRFDAYAALGERLQRIADWLVAHGHEAEVMVDSNFHVDREAAIRSGVGFSGKHTNVITRRHGSWVVLGTIVTTAPLEPTPPMRPGCGSCTRCIDACPTDAIIDGEIALDATRCITYWTQSKHSIPNDVREAMEDRAYGCDICQDVCPWNRGVELRRSELEPVAAGIDLVDWLTGTDADVLGGNDRLFVPRRRAAYLRRNAIVAMGNQGRESDAALVAPYLEHDDPMLREHAEWALRRIGGPLAAAALARA